MYLVLSVLAFALVSSQAQAAKFSVFGDVNMHNTKTTPSAGATSSAKLGFGFGVGAEFSLAPTVGLSIEAIYEMHKAESAPVTISTTALVFPVAARIWLSPMFNLLAGGYYSMAMGDITAEAGGVSASVDYATAGAKKSDYGAVAGLGLSFPGGFFFDARYYLGLADLNDPATAGVTTKSSNIQGLIGMRFGSGK